MAGAGGVVATERPIFSDLAARCAVLMTRELFARRESFAAAMQTLYRRLAHAGNPLAFLFVHLGHAELSVAP
jgi:hypothetical protein